MKIESAYEIDIAVKVTQNERRGLQRVEKRSRK